MSLGCGLCYCYGSVRIHLRSYEAIVAVQRRRIAASGTANPMKSLNHATRYTSINRGAFAATLNGCFGSAVRGLSRPTWPVDLSGGRSTPTDTGSERSAWRNRSVRLAPGPPREAHRARGAT